MNGLVSASLNGYNVAEVCALAGVRLPPELTRKALSNMMSIRSGTSKQQIYCILNALFDRTIHSGNNVLPITDHKFDTTGLGENFYMAASALLPNNRTSGIPGTLERAVLISSRC